MPEASGGHEVSLILLAVALILLVAKLGGHVFESLGMPAVLGELVGGILLGNLTLLGLDWFEFLRHDMALEVLAEIGIIFLLFTIGLESKLSELLRVGLSSLLVATLGVIVPFFLHQVRDKVVGFFNAVEAFEGHDFEGERPATIGARERLAVERPQQRERLFERSAQPTESLG